MTDVPLGHVPVAQATHRRRSRRGRRAAPTSPSGQGEEVTFSGRTIRSAAPPHPDLDDHRHGLIGGTGTLLVAGLSNEEFSSRLRRIPFPFGDELTGNSLEIFHVSHGKWETAAPIRTFVPYDDGASILASYTCTPVVHFPTGRPGHRGPRWSAGPSPSSAR